MTGNVLDHQRGWADRSEAEQNVEIADIPCYVQMAGRRGHSSVSNQPSIDYIIKNAERLTDAEKDSIHQLNILPEQPCTAHFSLSNKDTYLSQLGIRKYIHTYIHTYIHSLFATPNMGFSVTIKLIHDTKQNSTNKIIIKII